MAIIVRKVHSHVKIGQLHSLCTAVNRVYNLRSAAHGVNREAPCVAEHIQYALPLCIVFEQQSVLTLVNKEARFLPFQPVDMEFQAVFNRSIIVSMPVNKTVFLSQCGLERQRCLTFIINIPDALAHHVNKHLAYLLTANMHAYAVGLHHCCRAVAINNQSGQTIALAMYQPVRVIVRIICHTNTFPHRKRRLYSAAPEALVNDNILKAQHPYGNGSFLVMAYGYAVAVGRYHPYGVAFSYAVVHVMDGT